MVAVVVDDRNATGFAHLGEAALDTGKACKAFANNVLTNAQPQGNRNRRERILHVMLTDHR